MANTLKRPKHAKAMANVKPGDKVYAWSSEDGLMTYVIVAMDGEFPVTVAAGDIPGQDGKLWAFYATDSQFASIEDAMRHGAESDVEYHEPKLRYAKKLLKAIEQGSDLSGFAAGDGSEDSTAEASK